VQADRHRTQHDVIAADAGGAQQFARAPRGLVRDAQAELAWRRRCVRHQLRGEPVVVLNHVHPGADARPRDCTRQQQAAGIGRVADRPQAGEAELERGGQRIREQQSAAVGMRGAPLT
jgi:hypothetical protein